MTTAVIGSANDTHLNAGATSTNYGVDAQIIVGNSANTYSGLIKFDLSSIPANALITSAVLSLTIAADNSNNARTFRAYQCLRNWVEGQATWNVYSSGNNWTTAGAAGAGTDYNSTAWASTSFTATEAVNSVKTFSLDVTEFTKYIDGTYTNYGWVIRADTEANDQYAFHSQQGATSAYRPYLTVEYTTVSGNFFLMF